MWGAYVMVVNESTKADLLSSAKLICSLLAF